MSLYKKILYFFCSSCRPNRSRTVRYAFPVMLSALAFLGALTINSTNQTFIEIVPSQTSVRAGDSLTLDVYVTAHQPINAVDISLSIPDSQLEVRGIDVGESVITLWTNEPYYEDGVVYLRGGTFRKGFLGRHLIANINVKAIDTGLAYVDVYESLLLAGDGNATEIPVSEDLTEQVKLYIASEDGTYTPVESDSGSTFKGIAEIRIVTDIDGDVSLKDISQFMAAWRTKSTIFDFNGDGRMTFRDFAIILSDSFLH